VIDIDTDLSKLKLEISQGWRLLLRHKWRRPAWIRFPRSVMEDVRFINLSDRAKAAVPILLILASEDQNAQLPNAEIVFRSLRKVGISQRKDSFISLIHELIQSGFFLKTSPECRVQSTDYRKKEYTSAREASRGFASPTLCALETTEEKRLGEEAEKPSPLGQPKPQWSTPWIEEVVTNPLEASLIRLSCARRSGFVPRRPSPTL
jgi:hypothetical protein